MRATSTPNHARITTRDRDFLELNEIIDCSFIRRARLFCFFFFSRTAKTDIYDENREKERHIDFSCAFINFSASDESSGNKLNKLSK